jgi:hypothetical protein
MPIKRRKKTGGRKVNPILQAYTEKYKLTPKQRELTAKCLVQLALCQSEEARRLILGVAA